MLCSENVCTRCGACRNICNHDAIDMVETSDGGFKPQVNEKCVECGLCSRICPGLKNDDINYYFIPKSYAFYTKIDENNKKSASGGAFYKLAEYIINEKGGVIFGAIFDKEFKPKITFTELLDGVESMRGSKYAYSDTGYTFKKVKEYLQQSRYVLYSGLPCQIVGLKSYLGREYKKLITVEILCHGAPTPNLIKKYIEYIEQKLDDKVIAINQRDSSEKWNKLITKKVKIQTQSGRTFYFDENTDPYLVIYAKEIAYQKSCYSCKYATLKRNADFTLGDFGGLGLYEKFNSYNKLGISLIITNSGKAERILNELEDVFLEERSLKEAMIFNTCLYKSANMENIRDKFYEDYNKLEFEELYCKYTKSTLKDKLKLAIKKCIGVYNSYDLICWIIYKIKVLTGQIDDVEKIYIEYLSYFEKINYINGRQEDYKYDKS